MKNIDDVRVDGNDLYLSLKKITGLEVADIYGYVSHEFDEPCFKLCRIVFANGTSVRVDGEHDFPYIGSDERISGLDDESLSALDPDRDDDSA